MALTQSAWTIKGSDKLGVFVAQCTVQQTTAENDAYTLRTPKQLNGSLPFTLLVSCSATPDGTALPLDVWVGHSDKFALSGNDSTVAATDGAKFKQVLDDVVLAVSPVVYAITFDPTLPVADVVTVAAIGTGLKVRVPPAPYFAFNLNGAGTLNAATTTYTIIQ